MATPINTFKTVTADLVDGGDTIYTAPQGITTIVLLAQVSNVTGETELATVAHVSGTDVTELIKDFAIPGNDSASAITGKLVIESGNSLYASAGADDSLKIVVSLLETRNV
jgi:hypothetical protein